MTKSTVDIIEAFITSLTVDVEMDAITDLGDNVWKIETSNTWWLTTMTTIEINSNTYTVQSFEINESLTVKASLDGSTPSGDTFTLDAPHYEHGTIKMTQSIVDAIKDKTGFFPFVWLYEVINDEKDTDDESMIDREVELRLFFLDSAMSKDWLTDDHYQYVINPMQSMVDLFIDNIKQSRFFTYEMDYKIIPLVNFSENGTQEKSIFDYNLTGIECRLSAKIREDLSCI